MIDPRSGGRRGLLAHEAIKRGRRAGLTTAAAVGMHSLGGKPFRSRSRVTWRLLGTMADVLTISTVFAHLTELSRFSGHRGGDRLVVRRVHDAAGPSKAGCGFHATASACPRQPAA